MTNKMYVDKFGLVRWKNSDKLVDSPNITYIDNNGYFRYRDTDGLVHRDIAYRYIYSADRKKYPLQFRDYQVHHKDNEKQNNRWDNLQIVTETEHEDIQGYKFQTDSRKRPFYEDPEIPTYKSISYPENIFDTEKYNKEMKDTAETPIKERSLLSKIVKSIFG